MLDAGAAGESVVARIRLALTALLLLIPAASAIMRPSEGRNYIGIGITLCAMGLALVVYVAVRRDMHRAWVGLATTIFDVSLVSAALGTFLLLGQAHLAVNSRVVFEAYFIAIGATSLRYDVRLCLVAGLLAVTQYLGIVWYADATIPLNHAYYAPFVYGMFDWTTQISRLVLLIIATILSVTVVLRAQQLRRLSTIDRMTGVYNRGYFDERLGAELSRARRQSEPLAVVMLDVDHFKTFNDRYGHAAGDAGLRALTTLIRHSIRRSDLVARYGGEEFVLVLPITTAGQAVDKLEAVRRAVAQLSIRLPKQETVARLTVSAGIAIFPEDGVTADELIDQADARLFEAKESGRNRVVGPPLPEPAVEDGPPARLKGAGR
jgi:diguanylate cyclase (GGDEF)-like protein